MKKLYFFGPVVIIGALAAFFFTRNGGKTPAEQPSAVESSTTENGNRVTAAQWSNSGEGSSGAGGEGASSSSAGKSAAAPQGEVAEATTKLMKVSGIEKKFLSMAPMLKEQLEMMVADQMMSEKDRDEFLQKFRKNISSEKLLADLQEKVAENFSEQELSELVATYENPLVDRFNKINNDLTDPEKMKDMGEEISEFMKDADVNNIQPERAKEFARIDKAYNITEQAVDLTMSLYNISGEDGKIDPELRKQVEGTVRQENQKGLMWMTKDFQEQELKEFANTVDKESVRKFNQITHEVVKKPVMAWSKDLQEMERKKAEEAEKAAAANKPASATPKKRSTASEQ